MWRGWVPSQPYAEFLVVLMGDEDLSKARGRNALYICLLREVFLLPANVGTFSTGQARLVLFPSTLYLTQVDRAYEHGTRLCSLCRH